MGEKLRKQENQKVTQRMTFENVKRALFSSVVCILCMPIVMIINTNTLASSEMCGTMLGILIFSEILSIAFSALSFLAMKSKDEHTSGLVYKSFWIFFELFSFAMIYANRLSGAGITFYSVMLVAITLVPVLPFRELVYGIIAELVYVTVLAFRFETNGFDIFNVIVLNAVLVGLSRYMYVRTIEHFRLMERVHETDDNVIIDLPTGLLNHRGLEKKAYSSIMQSLRDQNYFTLIMVDIDELQKYNLSYGSAMGDRLIQNIGEVVKGSVIKHTDIVSRMDGGRFIVCMECSSEVEIKNVAERIRMMVDRKRIPQGRQASASFVSVSVGIAYAIPKEDNDFYELYDVAENAMFNAKDNGGNQTVCFGATKLKGIKKAT